MTKGMTQMEFEQMLTKLHAMREVEKKLQRVRVIAGQ